jgi:hypothetical protein
MILIDLLISSIDLHIYSMNQLVGEKGKSAAVKINRSPMVCAPRNPIWIAFQSGKKKRELLHLQGENSV